MHDGGLSFQGLKCEGSKANAWAVVAHLRLVIRGAGSFRGSALVPSRWDSIPFFSAYPGLTSPRQARGRLWANVFRRSAAGLWSILLRRSLRNVKRAKPWKLCVCFIRCFIRRNPGESAAKMFSFIAQGLGGEDTGCGP